MWSFGRGTRSCCRGSCCRPLIAVVDDGDDDGAGQSAEPRWFNFAISISVSLFFRVRDLVSVRVSVYVCVRFLVCTSAGSYCAYGRLSPSGSSRSESSQTGRIRRRTSQDLPLVESAWDIHTVVRTCPGDYPTRYRPLRTTHLLLIASADFAQAKSANHRKIYITPE